jgi:hypothetical protein
MLKAPLEVGIGHKDVNPGLWRETKKSNGELTERRSRVIFWKATAQGVRSFDQAHKIRFVVLRLNSNKYIHITPASQKL